VKRKLSSFIIIVSSFFLITGTAFSETKQVSVSSNLESNERGEIKVDLGPAPPNAIKSVIPFEESNP
jgi:hypothetical protein